MAAPARQILTLGVNSCRYKTDGGFDADAGLGAAGIAKTGAGLGAGAGKAGVDTGPGVGRGGMVALGVAVGVIDGLGATDGRGEGDVSGVGCGETLGVAAGNGVSVAVGIGRGKGVGDGIPADSESGVMKGAGPGGKVSRHF